MAYPDSPPTGSESSLFSPLTFSQGNLIFSMPDQNTNATAGDNAGSSNADTSAANKQNEGAAGNSSNTSNDTKQNEGQQQNQSAKTFTQDEVNSLLAKERKDAEKKQAAAEAKAKLSEDERTKADLAETRAALRERDTRDAVIEKAGTAGVKNPRLFYNAYKSEIETDDKGNITNLKEVLAMAKTDSPELFAEAKKVEGSADGGEGNNNNTGGLTKEMIEKMSDKEIADNMEKIDQFFASQK